MISLVLFETDGGQVPTRNRYSYKADSRASYRYRSYAYLMQIELIQVQTIRHGLVPVREARLFRHKRCRLLPWAFQEDALGPQTSTAVSVSEFVRWNTGPGRPMPWWHHCPSVLAHPTNGTSALILTIRLHQSHCLVHQDRTNSQLALATCRLSC